MYVLVWDDHEVQYGACIFHYEESDIHIWTKCHFDAYTPVILNIWCRGEPIISCHFWCFSILQTAIQTSFSTTHILFQCFDVCKGMYRKLSIWVTGELVLTIRIKKHLDNFTYVSTIFLCRWLSLGLCFNVSKGMYRNCVSVTGYIVISQYKDWKTSG